MKIFKIILINLLLLFVAYVTIDILCFVKNVKHNQRMYTFSSAKVFTNLYLETYRRMFYTAKDYDRIFIDDPEHNAVPYRTPMNVDSDKPPVLIMGCSFAYGNDLKQEQSLTAKLANLTGRPVYNRAIGARGLDEMLYQLRSEKFYSIVPKPEWFIYIFIPDQIRRTLMPCSIVDLGVFYDKDLKLKHDINFPLLYIMKEQSLIYAKPEYFDYTLAIIREIKKEIQNHWGNDVKLFFLFYEEKDGIYEYMNPVLQEEGFITSTVYDLVNNVNIMSLEYRADDKVHPSESAWDLLTPAIVEKLGL